MKFRLFILFAFILFSGLSDSDRGITELMRACRKEGPEKVGELIRSGCDVNEQSLRDGKTVFDYAFKNPDPYSIIRILLARQAKADWHNDRLFDVLRQAKNEHAQSIENALILLLDSRENPDCDYLLGGIAYYTNNERLLSALFKHKPNVNYRAAGPPPLINAIRGDNPVTVEFLLKNGADPNTYDYDNRFAIYQVKSLEVMKIMLKYGADITIGKRYTEDFYPNFNSKSSRQSSKAFHPLSCWSAWIDRDLLTMALRNGCTIDRPGMVAAGDNPHLPDIFDLLAAAYGQQEIPLDDMLSRAVFSLNFSNIEFLIGKGAVLNPSSQQPYGRFTTEQDRYKFLELAISMKCDFNRKAYYPNGQQRPSILWTYVSRGDVAGVELLLKSGVEVKLPTGDGPTCLYYFHDLPQEKSLKILDLLIRYGADINAAGKHGITPLMVAALEHRLDMAELLIKKGARVNEYDESARSPLFYAAFYPGKLRSTIPFLVMYQPSENGDAMVELLLRHGAQADTLDVHGASPMTEAGAWASPKTLKLLYQAGGAKSLNAFDECMMNAFLYAVNYNNDTESVKFILEAGADINSMISYDKLKPEINRYSNFTNASAPPSSNISPMPLPPLLAAVQRNKPELLKLLLKHGLDPNGKYKSAEQEMTPLECSFIAGEIEKILLDAGVKYPEGRDFRLDSQIAEYGNVEELQKALKELPPVDEKKRKKLLDSALWEAVSHNRVSVVEFLLNQGAELNDVLLCRGAGNIRVPEMARYVATRRPSALKYLDSIKQTALHYAATPEAVDFLVRNGLDVNRRDQDGNTPLLCLFERNDPMSSTLETFIKNGADIHMRNSKGENLLAIALKKNDEGELIKTLVKYGANLNEKCVNGMTPLEFACERGNGSPFLFELLVDLGADVKAVQEIPPRLSPYIKQRLNDLKNKQSNL